MCADAGMAAAGGGTHAGGLGAVVAPPFEIRDAREQVVGQVRVVFDRGSRLALEAWDS